MGSGIGAERLKEGVSGRRAGWSAVIFKIFLKFGGDRPFLRRMSLKMMEDVRSGV